MDAKFLREEFLRLSALYPELRNGLVVGEDESWLNEIDRSESIIGGYGLEVVGQQFMKNDARAHTFYLWGGPSDRDRAEKAIDSFESLANIAGAFSVTRSLPGQIPLQCTVEVGIGAVDRETGEVTMFNSPPDDLVHKWVSHVFCANAVQPHRAEVNNKDQVVVARCEILLLPIDLFSASVFALDGTAAVDTSELHFATSPQAVRDLKGTHNGRTPVIQRNTEWRKVYELLAEKGVPEGDNKRNQFVKDYNAQYANKPRPGKPGDKWPLLNRTILGQRICDYRKK